MKPFQQYIMEHGTFLRKLFIKLIPNGSKTTWTHQI